MSSRRRDQRAEGEDGPGQLVLVDRRRAARAAERRLAGELAEHARRIGAHRAARAAPRRRRRPRPPSRPSASTTSGPNTGSRRAPSRSSGPGGSGLLDQVPGARRAVDLGEGPAERRSSPTPRCTPPTSDLWATSAWSSLTTTGREAARARRAPRRAFRQTTRRESGARAPRRGAFAESSSQPAVPACVAGIRTSSGLTRSRAGCGTRRRARAPRSRAPLARASPAPVRRPRGALPARRRQHGRRAVRDEHGRDVESSPSTWPGSTASGSWIR